MTALPYFHSQPQHPAEHSFPAHRIRPTHNTRNTPPSRVTTRLPSQTSAPARQHSENATSEPGRTSSAMPASDGTNGVGSAAASQNDNRTPQSRNADGLRNLQRSNSASFSRRPSTAPGNQPTPGAPYVNGAGASAVEEDDDRQLVLRPAKPPLLRSQSEYASPHRVEDDMDHIEDEHYEWGARHGFEDHYQSEDIISQLANVSGIYLLLTIFSLFTLSSSTLSTVQSTISYREYHLSDPVDISSRSGASATLFAWERMFCY